jgi:hypothetical protein
MNEPSKRYWFPAKRYGWGWGLPATWQGWVIFLGWFALLIVVSPWLAERNIGLFFAFIALMSAAIIAICYIKGEPPRWRWGGDRPADQN